MFLAVIILTISWTQIDKSTTEILNGVSFLLEPVAIFPQVFMLHRYNKTKTYLPAVARDYVTSWIFLMVLYKFFYLLYDVFRPEFRVESFASDIVQIFLFSGSIWFIPRDAKRYQVVPLETLELSPRHL